MDRDDFLRGLEAYHLERGRAFTPGRLLGQKVDLYEMFVTAMRQGGFPRINKNNKWGFLAKHLRLVPKDKPPSAQDLEQVKRYYVKWIRHFEGEKVPAHVKKHLIPPGMELPCRRSTSSSAAAAAAPATAAASASGATTFAAGGLVGYLGGGGGAAAGMGMLAPGLAAGAGLQPPRGMYMSPTLLGGGSKAAVATAGYIRGGSTSSAGGLVRPLTHAAFLAPSVVFPCGPMPAAPGFAAAGLGPVSPMGAAGGGGGSSSSSSMLLRPAAACAFDPAAAFAAAASSVSSSATPSSLPAGKMTAAGAQAAATAQAAAAALAAAAAASPGADELLLANCIPGARTRNERRFLQQQQQQIVAAPGAVAAAALAPSGVTLSIPPPYPASLPGAAQPGIAGEINRRRRRLFMRYSVEAVTERRRKRRRREAFIREGRLPPALGSDSVLRQLLRLLWVPQVCLRLQQCLEERCLAPADAAFALNVLYYLSQPTRHSLSVEMHPGLVDQLSVILAEAAVRARVGLLQQLQDGSPFGLTAAAVSPLSVGDETRQCKADDDAACLGIGLSSFSSSFPGARSSAAAVLPADEAAAAAVVDWPTFFAAIYDTRASPAAVRANLLHQPLDPTALLLDLVPFDWSTPSPHSSSSNSNSSGSSESTARNSSSSSSRKQSSSKRRSSTTSHPVNLGEDDMLLSAASTPLRGGKTQQSLPPADGGAGASATTTAAAALVAAGSHSRRANSRSRSTSSSRASSNNSSGNGAGGGSCIRANSSRTSSFFQPYLWASSPGGGLLLAQADSLPTGKTAAVGAARVQADLQVVQLVSALLSNLVFDSVNALYFAGISRRELRGAAAAVLDQQAAGISQSTDRDEDDDEEEVWWREGAAGRAGTAAAAAERERRHQLLVQLQQQQEKRAWSVGGSIAAGDSSTYEAAAAATAGALEEAAEEEFFDKQPESMQQQEAAAEDAEREARDESDIEAAALEEELLVGMAEVCPLRFKEEEKETTAAAARLYLDAPRAIESLL